MDKLDNENNNSDEDRYEEEKAGGIALTRSKSNFTHSASEIRWKYANFLGGTQEDNIECKAKGKWSVSKIFGSERGINIRSQIIMPNILFTNSIVEVTIKVTLHGTSNLWIFTRYNSPDDEVDFSRCPVIVINKQECVYSLPCTRIKAMIGFYIKRQDVAGLGIEEQKLKQSNTTENLTFGDENVGETPSQRSSAIDKLISIDQLFIKFTIRDLAENGIEILFYDSRDRVKTTMVWTPHKDRNIKTKMRTASKVSTTDVPDFDNGGEMLIAGSGNSVYIRDIRVKKKEKIQIGHDIDTRSYECCTIF